MTIRNIVLKRALKEYEKYKSHKRVKKHTYIIIIDYTQHSSKKRLYLYDRRTKKIVRSHHTAHGTNSAHRLAPGHVKSFSNRIGSRQSNQGSLVTGATYWGKYGESLNIHGLEKGINSNCFVRRIVFHKSKYVTDSYIAWRGRAGLSWGCPAMDGSIFDSFRDLVKGGTFCYFNGKK